MNLIKELKQLGGYWKYDGRKYLAELTSGKVSDVFCNTGVLTCKPHYLSGAVSSLLSESHSCNLNKDYNLYVCAPAVGGITLAYEFAKSLSNATAIFTEPTFRYECPKDPKDSFGIKSLAASDCEGNQEDAIMLKTGQELKRFTIPDGAKVLFVEDVITTGKSTKEMIGAVLGKLDDEGVPGQEQFSYPPYVLCLVNRSGVSEVEVQHDMFAGGGTMKFEIISLADVTARTWDTADKASDEIFGDESYTGRLKAVRPKENWSLLLGK